MYLLQSKNDIIILNNNSKNELILDFPGISSFFGIKKKHERK